MTIRIWKRILLCFLFLCLSSCSIGDFVQKKDEIGNVAEDLADDGRFYYDQLNAKQKEIYQYIYLACSKYQGDIIFPEAVSDEDFSIVYFAFLKENPMFYWLDQYEYSYMGDSSRITSVRYFVPEDVEAVTSQLNEAIDAVIATVDPSWSTYETIKYLYTWIVENTTFAHNDYDQDLRSVLLLKESVCNGYAKTLKVFCDRLGIPCIIQVGIAEDEYHAWNAVMIDGEYYWVDATWGDMDGDERYNDFYDVMYSYLCIPDDLLFVSHEIIEEMPGFEESIAYPFQVPSCTSWQYDYYVLQQRFFTSYDAQEIHSFFCNAIWSGWYAGINLQFQTDEAYFAALNDLFNDEDPMIRYVIRDAMGAGMVDYGYNPYLRIIYATFKTY